MSTGRQHGFESLAERRLLLALDFAGSVHEVLSQPFRLRFDRVDGKDAHIPDFLALTPGASWLLDVRPGGLIKEEDEVRFAAAARAAAAVGWRYAVVTGWHRQVMTGLADPAPADGGPAWSAAPGAGSAGPAAAPVR